MFIVAEIILDSVVAVIAADIATAVEASTASPPPPRWQLIFLTVGVQLEHL